MLAIAAKDIAALDALLTDDLAYTHPSARLDTKQSLIANMKSGATVYSAVEPSEVRAQRPRRCRDSDWVRTDQGLLERQGP